MKTLILPAKQRSGRCIQLWKQNGIQMLPNFFYIWSFYSITAGWGVSHLVSWYPEPSQPQRTTSGLKTNFNLSSSHYAHKSSNHKFSKIHHISPDTNSHKVYTQTWNTIFFLKISPFSILPLLNTFFFLFFTGHKARTRWYRGAFRRFINTGFWIRFGFKIHLVAITAPAATCDGGNVHRTCCQFWGWGDTGSITVTNSKNRHQNIILCSVRFPFLSFFFFFFFTSTAAFMTACPYLQLSKCATDAASSFRNTSNLVQSHSLRLD